MIRIAILLGCLAVLAGCATVAGAGEDVSNSARWVQRQL